MFQVAQVAVLAKIILTVVIFDPQSIDTFSLPKSVAAHSMSLVIAALLVWLLARHGRALLFWSPLHVGAGALLVAFTLATPFALDQTVALFGVYRRYLGLTQMFDNVLLYLAVGMLFRDIRSLRLLTTVAIGVAVPVLAYALVQRLGLDPFTFVQATTIIPISTLGNPDLVGGFVSIIGITALALAVLLPGPVLAWQRVALALLGLTCSGILYVTGVRAGVLALGAGWLAAAALALRMPSVGRGRRLALAGLAALMAIGVIASPLRDRLASTVLADDLAVTNRLDIWQAAVGAVRERPLLGLGPDNFAAAYPPRRGLSSLKASGFENSTHDVWLYVATSAGLVGLAAMALFVALALRRAFVLARDDHPAAFALVPLLAYLGQALVNVNELVLDWTFWVSMGVIAGGAAAVPVARSRRPVSRTAIPVGVVALATAIAAAAIGTLPRVAAGEAMLAAEAYSNAGHPATSLSHGENALRMDGRRAEVWTTHGSALFRAREYTPALVAFTVAAERQPWSPLPWTNLAAAWAAIGNGEAAYRAAQRGLSADPLDQTARAMVIELGYQRGDFARSAAEGEKAISLGFADEQIYVMTISSYIRLKDLERAETLAREAVQKFKTAAVRLQFAAVIADRGRTAEALSIVDEVLRSEPTNANALRLRQSLASR